MIILKTVEWSSKTAKITIKKYFMGLHSNQPKIKAFEYLITKLIEWHNAVAPNMRHQENLNKLKLIKLQFFASAVNASESEDGLLKIFDNFYAMPYGHVESDTYQNITNLSYFQIDNSSVVEISPIEKDYFSDIKLATELIDQSVNALREKNNNLVIMNAMDLVELSHEWYSWRASYNLARALNKQSISIPIEMIKSERKFFSLEN